MNILKIAKIDVIFSDTHYNIIKMTEIFLELTKLYQK